LFFYALSAVRNFRTAAEGLVSTGTDSRPATAFSARDVEK